MNILDLISLLEVFPALITENSYLRIHCPPKYYFLIGLKVIQYEMIKKI